MTSAPSNEIPFKRRILGAGFWTLAGYGAAYPIRLLSSVVMTRLLAPQMFGVIAIAYLVMTALAMFSDVGLGQNIIQSTRGADRDFLNTAWSIQIVRGVILSLIGVVLSIGLWIIHSLGWVPKSSVYADPYLPSVIAVVSLGAAIGGLQSTKVAEAHRLLSIGRVTLIGVIGQVATVVCTIGWALIDRSIWALVAGGLFSAALTVLLSHVWLPGIDNRWKWDKSAVHEIVHFGKWIFLSSILGFLANNADRVLLGGFVDSTVLGIYSIALNMSNAVGQPLSRIVDVSFPALSEVARDRSTELKRFLYRFHVPITAFTYLCAGALIVSGNSIIALMYDRRYHEAGWMLEVLAVGLLSVPFNLSVYSLLARGLSKLFSNVVAICTVATLLFIPLGYHFFGVAGAMWGIVAGRLSFVPATIFYQYKHGLLNPLVEVALLPAILAGMLLGEGVNVALSRW